MADDEDMNKSLLSKMDVDEDTQVSSQPRLLEKPDLALRWPMLVLICFALVGDFYCYDNPAALKTQLKDMFSHQMTDSEFESKFQFLYSAYAFPNIVLPFIGGFLVDKYGVRVTMFTFALIICIAQCVFAFGCTISNFWVMLLGRILFGLGGETLTVAQNVILSEWYKGRELALSFGVTLSFCRGGSVWNNYFSPMLANNVSLTFSLWFGAMVSAGSLASIMLLIPMDLRAEAYLKKKNAKILKKAAPMNMANEGGQIEGEGGAAAEGEEISLSDVKNFGTMYWLMVLITVCGYGVIQTWNNTASSFLLERDYFKSPPSIEECCCWDPADNKCFETWPSDDWSPTNPSLVNSNGSTCTSQASCQRLEKVGVYAPVLNLTASQLAKVDCDKDSSGSYDPYFGLGADATPAVEENWPPLTFYCDLNNKQLLKAALMMSIPYYVNIAMSPFLGMGIDRFGYCATVLVITPAMFCLAHILLGFFPSIAAPTPLVIQGVGYAFFAAALWPPIVYVVEKKSVGTAYGVQTAMLNFGTFIFPIIASLVYDKAGDTYLPGTEIFYAVLAACAFLAGVWLWIEDSRSGSELNRSHWFDNEEIQDCIDDGLVSESDVEDEAKLPQMSSKRVAPNTKDLD